MEGTGWFEALTGDAPGVFIGVTLVLFGFCAWMTGQAMAVTWRPWWHLAPYMIILTFGDRFTAYALYDSAFLLPSGYAIDVAVLLTIASIAFRLTQTRRMVTQYPWLYVRTGLFSWREKSAAETSSAQG